MFHKTLTRKQTEELDNAWERLQVQTRLSTNSLHSGEPQTTLPSKKRPQPHQPLPPFNPVLEPTTPLQLPTGVVEQSATQILYQTLYALASNICWNMVHENNEDLIAESVNSIMLNLGEFKGKSRFSTWVWSRIVNDVKDYIRKKKSRLRGKELSLESLPEDIEISNTIGCVDDKKAIEKAVVEVLSPEQTDVVRARLEGYSFEEIAEVLDVPLSTTKNRWLSALEAIRRRYGTAEQGGLKAAGPSNNEAGQ